jgi:hypothetical protein
MHSKSRGTLRRDGRKAGRDGRQAGELLVGSWRWWRRRRSGRGRGTAAKSIARARIAGRALGKRTVKQLAAV